MAENKLIIGSLPVMRGAYDNATSYYRDNQVTMYGSTFQSLADDNVGFPPAELREDGKVYAINTDKWIIVANAIEAYNAGERIANAETRIKELGEYGDSPEFIRVYTDADGKFLWGIRVDGSVEWAKGVPTPIQNAIRELEDKLKTQDIKSLQDAIDNINKSLDTVTTSLQPLTDTFSIISNDEWLHAVVDAENRLLFGIKAENGEVVMPKQDTYKVVKNDEWLAAWLDSQYRILFGVKADGTFWAAKHNFNTGKDYDNQIEQINTTLVMMQGTLASVQESVKSLQSTVDDHTTALNSAVKLEDLDGVSNHNTPNLLIAAEMQKTFSDGTNSFTPPNEGYEMSNPIECQAGDWFTRTGTATGMVVVTDENDKNGTRLFNADGTTLGSTFQIPTDMTWVRYIRMAADVVGAEDGSVVICKGKVAYTGDDKGDYLTMDKLRVQNANIPKDIKYLKSPDGKYWELYVDDRHQLQIKEVDPEIITNLPSDFTKLIYSGDFGGYFHYLCSGFKYKFVLKAGGVTKYIYAGNLTASSYSNCEHVINKAGEERYIFGIDKSDINNCAEGIKAGITICDVDMNILDTGILLDGYNGSIYPDIHDAIFINDDHVILYSNRWGTTNLGGHPYSENIPFIREIKKENGNWKTIGEFKASDYPQLLTDAFGNFNAETIDSHQNTLEFDENKNLIVNCRNWDTWFIVKRTENSDGTVTLGSKTLDYNEAIIGRVGGRHNSGYLDNKRVLNDGFNFTDVPQSLTEVSDDDWEEWQWFHCHDVKYWGMKQVGDKQYPTYTLFDNNYWTQNELVESQYNVLNKHNNILINPNGSGSSYSSSKEDGTYENYQVSRVIQLSIDWENHKMMDYRIYVVPKHYAQQAGGATMYDEGVILVNYSTKARLFDFTQDETNIQGHVYKGAKELYSLDNSSYRTNTY